MARLIKRTARGRAGFTLVEAVMAIVIMAAVALPLAVMTVQHLESVVLSRDFSMGLHLARFEMERVNNMPYTAVTSASFSNYQGYPYDIVRTVVYAFGNDASAESLKEIRVEVRRTGESSALINFVTYIARNVAYGV